MVLGHWATEEGLFAATLSDLWLPGLRCLLFCQRVMWEKVVLAITGEEDKKEEQGRPQRGGRWGLGPLNRHR